LNANALKLPAVGMAHVVGSESNDQIAGQHKKS
jgi:hypothetical protein